VDDIPLLIDFVTPSSIFREHNRISPLRIIGNGPPGTFVVFPDGLRVSLPTGQIVFADDTDGHARVGFGGMQFVSAEEGHLVFMRIRELLPEDQLSPARSHTMLLDSHWGDHNLGRRAPCLARRIAVALRMTRHARTTSRAVIHVRGSVARSALIVTNGGVEPPRRETERSARTACHTPMVASPTLDCYPVALAELLGEADNDALRPADIG
jgi:hypothetical protein